MRGMYDFCFWTWELLVTIVSVWLGVNLSRNAWSKRCHYVPFLLLPLVVILWLIKPVTSYNLVLHMTTPFGLLFYLFRIFPCFAHEPMFLMWFSTFPYQWQVVMISKPTVSDHVLSIFLVFYKYRTYLIWSVRTILSSEILGRTVNPQMVERIWKGL